MKICFKILIFLLLLILALSGCVYKGTNDISLFIEKYNQSSLKNDKLELLGTQIVSDSKDNSFYFFIRNNLLLTVTESSENLLLSCSLCGENKNLDSVLISEISEKIIKSFCNLSDEEISEIIETLEIDSVDSYKKDIKKSHEYKIYSYDFLVNSLGFYIGIRYSK